MFVNDTEQRAWKWLHLAHEWDLRRTLVSAVINLRVLRSTGS